MELSRLATHAYTRVVFTCCYDVRHPPADPAATERNTLKQIEGIPSELQARLITYEKEHLGRWVNILIFTQRCVSGCGPSGPASAAVRLQDVFTYAKLNEASIGPAGRPSVERPPNDVINQLRSLIGYAYYRKYAMTRAERQSPAVTRTVHPSSPTHDLATAVKYAWLAVQGSLFTESGYLTFFAVRNLAHLLGIDLNKFKFWRRMGPLVAHREQEVISARLERMERDRNAGVESMPACALRECRNHRITRDQARRDRVLFMPCVGGCQIRTKPTYCSDHCRSSDYCDGHRKECMGHFAIDGGPIPDTIAIDSFTAKSLEHHLAIVDDEC